MREATAAEVGGFWRVGQESIMRSIVGHESAEDWYTDVRELQKRESLMGMEMDCGGVYAGFGDLAVLEERWGLVGDEWFQGVLQCSLFCTVGARINGHGYGYTSRDEVASRMKVLQWDKGVFSNIGCEKRWMSPASPCRGQQQVHCCTYISPLPAWHHTSKQGRRSISHTNFLAPSKSAFQHADAHDWTRRCYKDRLVVCCLFIIIYVIIERWATLSLAL